MSLDFFRIERGLEIDDLVQYLQGSGSPGAAGDTASALVGSVYTDNSTGAIYTKITAGSGTDKWQKLASEDYVNTIAGATISWREPAVVRENSATTLPTGTATQPIVVDSVSITDGQRVLFSAIVGGNGKNVYVYDQTNGVFVEDANAETSGDAVYVISGTSAGKTYIYNGSNWVQSDQSSLDEDGYIRSFIGKASVGNTSPSYSSTNFVSQSSALITAVSALDAELGPNVSLGNYVAPASKINANIQSIDTAIGANVTDGGFILAANTVQQNIQVLDTHLGVNFLAGNYISLNQTVSGAVTAIDVAIGPNVATGNFISSANKIQQNIQALDSEIGAQVTTGTYISDASTVNGNIQALDTAIGAVSLQTLVSNVTSIQTIDTVAGAVAAKWFVRAELASDSTSVYATEVYAITNGVTSDYTRYATLKLGAAISGLAVTVDLDGSNNLRLRVASTAAVNVIVRRSSVLVD